MTVQWHGYIERHTVSDNGRKSAGRQERITAPGEVLTSPDEVATWIKTAAATVAKEADPAAQEKNGLMSKPENVYRSLARKGQSVYASVHVTGREVVDLCVEAVPA